jgi:hypothetical protein
MPKVFLSLPCIKDWCDTGLSNINLVVLIVAANAAWVPRQLCYTQS